MTSPRQSHYQVIFHCIESASRFVPPVNSPAPALQSLREMIPSMPAAGAMAETDDGPPATARRWPARDGPCRMARPPTKAPDTPFPPVYDYTYRTHNFSFPNSMT